MRVGVDIGGTFTDVVVFDEDTNAVALAKALTTPLELARGVQESPAKAAVPLGDASFLIHGSAVAVNAIIEHKGARTALVTTTCHLALPPAVIPGNSTVEIGLYPMRLIL